MDCGSVSNSPRTSAISVLAGSYYSAARLGNCYFAAWLLVGCLTICVDERLQPLFAAVGEIPAVRTVALKWQQAGDTWGIVTFLAIILFRCRHAFFPALIALGGTGFAAQVAKYLVGRVRPDWSGDVSIFCGPFGVFGDGHVPLNHIDSLPSGHTAVAFAMAYVLATHLPSHKQLWFIIATGVAISRTLLDVHFPSDVILGALLGTWLGDCATTRTMHFTRAQTASAKSTAG